MMDAMLRGISTRTQCVLIVLLVTLSVLVASVTAGRCSIAERLYVAHFQGTDMLVRFARYHFSSEYGSSYDVACADRYYAEALRRDPTLPIVHLQRARIAFLEGRFPDALRESTTEIRSFGDATPSAYYVRGLIEGFAGDYESAILDYEHFLHIHVVNWAALNDYAWVLLKANKPQRAYEATVRGLLYFPNNPWLLHSQSIALYELGRYSAALKASTEANAHISTVTEADWLHAYPGNDPASARTGVQALRDSIRSTMHTIESATSTGVVQ